MSFTATGPKGETGHKGAQGKGTDYSLFMHTHIHTNTHARTHTHTHTHTPPTDDRDRNSCEKG